MAVDPQSSGLAANAASAIDITVNGTRWELRVNRVSGACWVRCNSGDGQGGAWKAQVLIGVPGASGTYQQTGEITTSLANYNNGWNGVMACVPLNGHSVHMNVYDARTGRRIAQTVVAGSTPWV